MTTGMFGFVALWTALHAQGNMSGPLTLEQVSALAERQAFAVRLQDSVIEKNRQRVAESLGNLGPRLALGGTYNRFERANIGNFGGGPVVIQPIDQQTITGTITLPIDISGNNTRLARANQRTLLASQETLKATLNDARLNARSAYFGVLRAQAFLKVADQGVKDAQERLDQGQKLFKQVQIARIDVDRYNAQLQQAKADQLNAQNSLVLAKYSFNLTLARPIETDVALIETGPLPPLPEADDVLFTKAQEGRPELKAAQKNLEALALIRRAAESGTNPTMSLSIQQSRVIGELGLTGQRQNTTGTISVNFPIFDSGATRARVRQSQQDEIQARIQLEQTKLSISQEVRNAAANLGNSRAKLENALVQLQLAEEVFRLAKVKQDAGEGTYVEIIDAELTVTQARNSVVGARYDYLIAYAQLQRAIGSDAVPAASNGTKGETR